MQHPQIVPLQIELAGSDGRFAIETPIKPLAGLIKRLLALNSALCGLI
jgi:hypothetical protein